MALTSPEPLKLLTRLNETVYIFDPAESSNRVREPSARLQGEFADKNASAAGKAAAASSASTTSGNPPDLVIILSWGSAPPRAVAKYVAKHRVLFPTARLLLITTAFSELFAVPVMSGRKMLAPAISYIRDTVDASSSSLSSSSSPSSSAAAPKILVHAFSNGGGYKLVALAKEYKRSQEEEQQQRQKGVDGQRLPISAVIMDSAPGRPAPIREMRAISAILPTTFIVRQICLVILFGYVGLLHLAEAVTRTQPLFTKLFYQLLDPGLFDTQEVPRMYIYSNEDKLIDPCHVEEHARLAEEAGCSEVRLERFEGSKHVAHAVLDPTKYWSLITKFWEGSV